MARPNKNATIDYSMAHDLGPGLLERASCPDGLPFVLLKDSEKKGLRLRVTKSGGKHWQFETRLKSGKLFTRTLGEWPTVHLADARAEALRLRALTDKGLDPRELEREQAEAAAAKAAAEQTAREAEAAAAAKESAREAVRALTVGEVWTQYTLERRPHWGDLHAKDHERLCKPGGEPSKRGTRGLGVTSPGPLAPLMPRRLADLDAATIESWAAKEAETRPSVARLAWRLLKVFLSWCEEQPQYAPLLPAKNPAKTKRTRETLGPARAKDDVLERSQLVAWFERVRQIGNPVIAAYLQTLLLTGARPGEVLAIRWDDINTQWRGLTIRDKVEGERQIPLTPYIWHLLDALPRRNEWVFASTYTVSMDARNTQRRKREHGKRGTAAPQAEIVQASASGRLTDPSIAHRRACAAAGLEGLTLHGLRRSFASLTEWLEIPAGVVAQIQGHKPSATAEKHYKRRPLDLLRMHHERIEAWVLEQAKVEFDANANTEPGKLALVKGKAA